ncbi:tetratricopeptide repeat protein, partial [Bacillus thuringiensis]|nr:tetratricopeptide repeat protein [Bacillus thuringiensis]
MSVLLKGHEQIVNELNILYQVMVAEQLIEAKQLKEKIEKQINKIEADQNLSLYYSLLNFKYKVLTDWTNIKYDTFSQIVRLDNPITEDFITYYYHFFKAEHATIIGNYDEAKKEYEKAESLLKHVPGELEEAEYKYKFAIFNHHTNKPLTAINYANQAKEIFSKYPRYEIKIALCENILG